jgi:hypothetical protein
VGRLVEMTIVTDAESEKMIWMDNLNCPNWPTNPLTHIEQCQHNNKDTLAMSGHGHWKWGTHNCDHSQDIGVGCDEKTAASSAAA